MTITAVSLFAGVGGIDLGLERAGVRVVAAVEIDTPARGVIADRFPHIRLFNDVTEVTGEQLRDAGFVPERGLVAEGFPCQDVSKAGRRAGMGRGTRSGLFWEVDRLVGELAPRWVLIENVPGLLSSNGGRDMGTVLRSLAERGYGYAYRVLDAQHFGVPQRRRRVFIVGCLGDAAGPSEVLLEPGNCSGDDRTRPQGREEPATAAAHSPATRSRRLTFQKVVRPQTDQHPDVWQERRVAATLSGFDSGPSRTIELVIEPDGVRRLTPLEWERLQGFPDDWTAYSSGRPQADSPRYAQMGNAVAVPCVEWIASRIVAYEEGLTK